MLLSAEMARNLYDVMDVHSMWHRLCFLGALSCFLSLVSFFFLSVRFKEFIACSAFVLPWRWVFAIGVWCSSPAGM